MLYTNGKSNIHFLEAYDRYRNIGIAIDIGMQIQKSWCLIKKKIPLKQRTGHFQDTRILL